METYEQLKAASARLVSIKNHLSSLPCELSWKMLVLRLQIEIVLLLQKELKHQKQQNSLVIPEEDMRDYMSAAEAVTRIHYDDASAQNKSLLSDVGAEI